MKKKNSFNSVLKFLFFLSPIFLLANSCEKEGAEPQGFAYPIKTAIYWTSPIIESAEQIQALARHELAILDLENMFNNFEALEEIKRLNPNIKLLAYYNAMEMWQRQYSTKPWQNVVISEIGNNRPEWILKRVNDVGFMEPAIFWPGMTMLNMSATCPLVNGQTYGDWLAEKLNKELENPIWDGFFLDNGTVNISWTHPGRIDIDGDGFPDDNEYVDQEWEKGMKSFLYKIKTKQSHGLMKKLFNPSGRNKEFIMMSNKGDTNLNHLVHGKFFEHFPNNYLGDTRLGGWIQCVDNIKHVGPLNVFQAQTDLDLDFILASALLLDNVYVAVGQDDARVFDRFYLDLGKPLDLAYREISPDIFIRDYENYQIKVDPLHRIGQIIPR